MHVIVEYIDNFGGVLQEWNWDCNVNLSFSQWFGRSLWIVPLWQVGCMEIYGVEYYTIGWSVPHFTRLMQWPTLSHKKQGYIQQLLSSHLWAWGQFCIPPWEFSVICRLLWFLHSSLSNSTTAKPLITDPLKNKLPLYSRQIVSNLWEADTSQLCTTDTDEP